MSLKIYATLIISLLSASLAHAASTPVAPFANNAGRTVSGGGLVSEDSALHNGSVVIGQWVLMSVKNADSLLVHTGDIDGDGKVDIADALLSLQSAAGLIHLSDTEILRGDIGPLVNDIPVGDGKIDIEDAILILRKAVGLSW